MSLVLRVAFYRWNVAEGLTLACGLVAKPLASLGLCWGRGKGGYVATRSRPRGGGGLGDQTRSNPHRLRGICIAGLIRLRGFGRGV